MERKVKKYKDMDIFTKQIESIPILDWYNIGGHWYTIEEYDEQGKEMTYRSLSEKIEMIIHTPNRYKTGLKGATIELVEPMYYRFKPSYYLPIKEFNKLPKQERKELAMYIAEWWEIGDLIDYLFN
jgi:hypothetical protein